MRAYTRFMCRWVVPAVNALAVTAVVAVLLGIVVAICVAMAHGSPATGAM